MVALTGVEPEGRQFSSVQLGLSGCVSVQFVFHDAPKHRREPATLSLGCHSVSPAYTVVSASPNRLGSTLRRELEKVAPAEFVKHHPRGLVASQGKLALEEERRDPALIGGHQVGSPEPNCQRRFRIMQNRPGRQ